jgi:hypothetical protein
LSLVRALGSQKEKYKSPSYQIREGDSVNIDVTSPGATLALGMMYFNTGNRYGYDHKAAACRAKCVLSVLVVQIEGSCGSVIVANLRIYA